MSEDKLYSRETGLKFTHIKIKTITKNLKYRSLFKLGYGENKFLIDTVIGGNSQQQCLEKTENFLQTKLEPGEYSFID